MNAQQLSERLKRVAAYVPPNAILADIGSDHAYLPCYLALKGNIQKGIAGEVVKGPYESARKQVQQEGLSKSIEVRLANGLAAVELTDNVTAVTIAGMGGPLIASILDEGKEKLAGVERLILQPNVHAKAIREWGAANGWKITEEEILKENDKIYEILVLEPSSSPVSYTEQELLMGPFLIKAKSPVFIEKWDRETSQWKRILLSMESTEQTVEILAKKQELINKIQLTEEVLHGENT
ncbi:tRNA (adenine(22)-N(1))-methyltransferase [Planococcus halotolerans]|uniref:tRNA (Adenine(22)-N(1))-methyltransferase TrmK n=1 Tax=Planococcus halotolerans TaxID=2233542 RepID=A0A365KUH4_9BACL|nr:tRNA (adenine(22)-N(1))-methyltransferase TrmK [Planococcus halotolerans]QHJ71493.1 tRNA (adenine(22)-N(1))-methyltransferase TrmK [Planococcus halotolerans]RAZ76651.1 tRNA (adenine(22)-N(1))-methyltransferase TrmK [Planococcus halotolerans]